MNIYHVSSRDVVRFMKALKEREPQKVEKTFSFMSLLFRWAGAPKS